MRFLTTITSAVLLILISTQVSAGEFGGSTKSHTCRLETGYGTAIGKGRTASEAEENARLICGTKIIDDYYARRGNIDSNADLELACINLKCQ